METALGCGYSIHDESLLTDFYSPPTSIIDEEEELFYPEDEEIPSANSDLQSISQTDLRDQLKPLPLKLMSIGTTTTPPTTPRNFLDPLQSTIMDFQKMKILPDLSLTNSFQPPTPTNFFPSTTTNSSSSSSIDRHSLLEPHGIYASSSELSNNNHSERSRLHSYLNPMDDSMMMMMMKSSSLSRPVQSLFPFTNNSLQDPWLLSEIVRQNNQQISLSSTAQQILNGNNRPLRSEKIDIEVIKHLIREANWKRQCGMKKEICVFCRNNGENELIYSSHSLKDPMGNVTCPILRAYQCPICGATGPQAHTIKYCQATGGDDHHHHRQLPTPYEKMLRMQTFDLDEQFQSSLLGQFSNPSSLYSNGWSDSYL